MSLLHDFQVGRNGGAAAPVDYEARLAAVPAELRALDQWVGWKEIVRETGPSKVPFQAISWNAAAKANDPTTWCDFDTAGTSWDERRSGFKGVGFVFSKDDPFVGVDFDGCLADGELTEWAAPWLNQLVGCYMEISPSGRGIKVFGRGRLPGTGARRPVGGGPHEAIEVYDRGRFFTVTGDAYGSFVGAIPDVQGVIDDLYAWVKQRPGKASAAEPRPTIPFAPAAGPRGKRSPEERAVLYLATVDPAISGQGGHDTTFRAACAIGPGFDLAPETAYRLIRDHYSPRCQPPWTDAEIRHKVDDAYEREARRGFLLNRPLNRAAPLAAARKASASAGADPAPIPWMDVAAPDDPFTLAMIHLDGHRHEGLATLRYHRGEFLSWRKAAWRPISDAAVEARTGSTVHDALMRLNATLLEDKGKKKATRKATGDVVAALRSLTLLEDDVESPAWIDSDGPFPASEVLPARNALVHLPGFVRNDPDAVLIPTPSFFCPYSLGYDFDEAAPAPVAWLDFLDSLWSGDRESIDALQEWFGYCLTPDTSQQKIMAMIGPKRSGKGTIARVLKALIGAENVAGPTLSGLATNFGLAPLIGRPVAIVSDARLSGRADQAVITERLLSISGEDTLTIDRKHREAWTGKLPTRLVILSNELPRLNDASGALVSRMVILRFTRSFYGVEDKGLFNRLIPELPGILLWAIEGWRRLNERGHFVQPQSGQDLIDQMNDLSSPVGAFVRERCEMGPALEVSTGELFEAWRGWCQENGRDHHGTQQNFGRDLSAVLGGVTAKPTHRDGKAVRIYPGIALKVAF